jgi:CRISPR/Cas system-associated exonuclease Cas4 (RecB family)
MYGYLYHVKHPEAPVKKLFLYSIRSDELIQIEVGMDVMKKIMVTIKEMDDDSQTVST